MAGQREQPEIDRECQIGLAWLLFGTEVLFGNGNRSVLLALPPAVAADHRQAGDFGDVGAVDGHRIDNRPVKCGLAANLERQRRLWLVEINQHQACTSDVLSRGGGLYEAVHRLSVECVGFQALGALGLKAQLTAIHLVADAVVLGAQFVGERRHDLEEPSVALADRQFRQIRQKHSPPFCCSAAVRPAAAPTWDGTTK